MKEKPIHSKEPVDRLTRLANRVIEALIVDPENNDKIRCIVMVNDQERGGIGIHNYDDERDAIVDMVVHLQAVFASQGKTLEIHPIVGPIDRSMS